MNNPFRSFLESASGAESQKDSLLSFVSPDQSWRPDWMDMNTGVYPDHGDDLSSWAWEFLRRNPEYQADYARWAALPDDDGNGNKSPKYDLNFGDWAPMEFCESLPSIPALAIDMAGAILSVVLVQLGQMGDHALVIETEFLSEDDGIRGHFFLVPDPGSLETILSAVGVR